MKLYFINDTSTDRSTEFERKLQDCSHFKMKVDLKNNNHNEKIMQADTLSNEEHINFKAQQNSSDKEGSKGDVGEM